MKPLIAAAILCMTTPAFAATVTITTPEAEVIFTGDQVGQCMTFQQGGLWYLSVEAGDEAGPGLYLDYSGDSVETAGLEFRMEPSYTYWQASNSPLYNNYDGGIPVESHITLDDSDGLVVTGHAILAMGEAFAETDVTVVIECD